MKKVWVACVAGLATAAWSAPAAAMYGDSEACARGDTAVLVRVDGFKEREGTLRVQIYGSNPADFLAKGKKLRRIDVPVAKTGRMEVCVALPAPGAYAVAVRHDMDGNGKSGWSDGGGFSRNPKLSLFHLKPSYNDVAIEVGRGVRPVDVRLLYRNGLSIGPARES
ncbi:DUF2141 domain-containing protein [Sphingomonas changbaiensis]|nr:DUF2141 domain-containing protein [Sphingomonas changbaiensis]